jgi:hypothetical protein
MVAVDPEDGNEAVRLHQEAITDFERKRVEIVKPALVSLPRAMELKLLPQIAPAELDGPTFDDLELLEASFAKAAPAMTKPVVRPSAAKSNAPRASQGVVEKSGEEDHLGA